MITLQILWCAYRYFVSSDLYAMVFLQIPEDILVKDQMDMEMEIEQLEQMENNDEQINGKYNDE